MDGETLYIRTLGDFSITWKGVQIAGGPKARDSYFVYLMQLLLHYHREGVSRSQLESVLFGERDVGDVRHSLRNVLYNVRRRLLQAGLPKTEYIRQEKNSYYWTEDIPVEEDARIFEGLCLLAEEEKDQEKKLELGLKACYCYTGEFLPRQMDVLWAVQEARRYQELFFSCVEETARLLRAGEDWLRLKELGLYVSQISPFANWEVLTLEALIALGSQKEARKLYEDTVNYYMQEQGIRPSKRLSQLLKKLGDQISHQHAVLDEIQLQLEEPGELKGGYFCIWPVFQGIYQMMERLMERSGQSVYLMSCTLVDSKGNPIEQKAGKEELSKRLKEAVCHSLRQGDVVTCYGKGQYLVLLTNTTREACRIIQRRINERFLIGRQRIGVSYCVSSVDEFAAKYKDGGRWTDLSGT